MPGIKQPGSLAEIALPTTVFSILAKYNLILRPNVNLTRRANKETLEMLNEILERHVPRTLLNRIRSHPQLAGLIYFGSESIELHEDTLHATPMHNHLILNVCPRLASVTIMNLTKVEGTLELFQAIGANCHLLKMVSVNTDLDWNPYTNLDSHPNSNNWNTWLLLLAKCKKLQVIFDSSHMAESGFPMIQSAETIASLLQKLPDLRALNSVKMAAALSLADMKSRVYPLRRLDVCCDNFNTPEDIHWLSEHCPNINHIIWQTFDDQSFDRVFNALADTDLKINTLSFSISVPEFTDATLRFYVSMGKYLHTLILNYGNNKHTTPTRVLSEETIIKISECCPRLKSFTFKGKWYSEDVPMMSHRKTMRLFPNLEYLCYEYITCLTSPIIPFLLKDLRELKVLKVVMWPNDAIDEFISTLESSPNEFDFLEKVEVQAFLFLPGEVVKSYLERFLLVALKWRNIKKIMFNFPFNRKSKEIMEYVELVRNQIRKDNFDLLFTCCGNH